MAEQDIYYSLKQASEGTYKEKGSKFLAYAFPVSTEAEVKNHLDELKKQYYDARHHCYAFIFKAEEGREETYRANDDGEPAHTAGDPILGQIRSQNLHDILVVVIRYFGGTKLGVPGLIHAYKTAAADALANSQIIKKLILKTFEVRFAYTATNEVMQLIDKFEAQIEAQDFAEDCYYMLSVPRSRWSDAKEEFSKAQEVMVMDNEV